MLSFVICDDNPAIMEKLGKMLESVFIKNHIEAHVVLQSTNATSVLDYIKHHNVDVFILDINLKSEMSGIDLASQIRQHNKKAYIIFTTGHLEYVMVAYKVKTFDYLPKPITLERLEETIIRLINDMQATPKRYIRLGHNNIINQDDINFIKRDGMKLIFYTKDKHYEAYTSFNKIQSCLSESFVRCHKSYMANIHKIQNIETSNNTILFDNKTTCFIGPKFKNNFLEVLKNDGIFSNHL